MRISAAKGNRMVKGQENGCESKDEGEREEEEEDEDDEEDEDEGPRTLQS